MTWRPGWTKRDEEAERRLADLKARQQRVEREMQQIRHENGFLRMVRESMGGAR